MAPATRAAVVYAPPHTDSIRLKVIYYNLRRESLARTRSHSLSLSLALSLARAHSLSRARVRQYSKSTEGFRADGSGFRAYGSGFRSYGLGRAVRQDSTGTKGPLKEHPRAVIEPDAAPIHAPREGLEEILKIQHTYKEMH